LRHNGRRIGIPTKVCIFQGNAPGGFFQVAATGIQEFNFSKNGIAI
jgi:hypothetical protein